MPKRLRRSQKNITQYDRIARAKRICLKARGELFNVTERGLL